MNEQTIVLLKGDVREEVDVILKFTIKEFNKEYIIYTKNEKDAEGNVLLYSATLVKELDGFRTSNIETDEEWTVIKELIRKIAKGECV